MFSCWYVISVYERCILCPSKYYKILVFKIVYSFWIWWYWYYRSFLLLYYVYFVSVIKNCNINRWWFLVILFLLNLFCCRVTVFNLQLVNFIESSTDMGLLIISIWSTLSSTHVSKFIYYYIIRCNSKLYMYISGINTRGI